MGVSGRVCAMPRSCADERVLCNAGGYEYRVRRLRSGAKMDSWTGPIFGLTVLTDEGVLHARGDAGQGCMG